MKKITEDVRKQIIDLYFKEKLNFSEIERKIEVSRASISGIINEYKKKTGTDIKNVKLLYSDRKKKGKNEVAEKVAQKNGELEKIFSNSSFFVE